jgi:hypothetical protein
MSLSDLASLGSFVSGVAVLISLIYLALQVRQAERNQRAQTQQEQSGRVVDFLMRLATPEMAPVYFKGLQGGDLTVEEFFRFRQMVRALISSYGVDFYQHRERLLSDATFKNAHDLVKAGFVYPGRQAMWRVDRERYESTFRAHVDAMMSDESSAHKEFADDFAEWRAALAAQTADA